MMPQFGKLSMRASNRGNFSFVVSTATAAIASTLNEATEIGLLVSFGPKVP